MVKIVIKKEKHNEGSHGANRKQKLRDRFAAVRHR